jgi:hypothetical protein
MFRWYQEARECYVYLIDFEHDEKSQQETENRFRKSRWWSRGWTLQELIAPAQVRFYDKNWGYYGNKMGLLSVISDITHIDVRVLESSHLMRSMSVAKRMSWAARRETSRQEDQAYSLLGIFDVNMPLLYGEGGVKAFYRLQEEIIRTSSFVDHSILAWMAWEGAPNVLAISYHHGNSRTAIYQNLLAPSPYGFRRAENIVSWSLPQSETFALTPSGLRLSLVEQPISRVVDDESLTAILNCRYEDERKSYITIWLEKRFRVDVGFGSQPRKVVDDIYDRFHTLLPTESHLNTISSLEVHGEKSEFTLAREPFVWTQFEDQVHVTIPRDLELSETFPADAFDASFAMLSLTTSMKRAAPQMNRAYGTLVLGRTRLKADQFVLTIDRWTSLDNNNTPRLLVGIFARSEVQDLQDGPFRGPMILISGKTHEFKGPKDSKVLVSARCVIVSGELFWSIHVCQEERVDVADAKDV